MDAEKIKEIFRRYKNGQTISQIARVEDIDRKTIKSYLKELENQGLLNGDTIPERDKFLEICHKIQKKRNKRPGVIEGLSAYETELREIINDPREPVKPKTAYLVIKTKYNLKISYSTFKRFVRAKKLIQKKVKDSIPIELPPGREIQIDYGKVGTLYDPINKRNRVVYSYTGILSHSRLPFVQFVFTQSQESFTGSTIDMFEFYNGVPEFISIDNLKSGVIKPDLYDPKLNKAFAEMAEHYSTFINTCRVNTPTDKPKVERMIPVARELFRGLKLIHENASIDFLNKKALEWSVNEYGQNPHGTTNIPPYHAYIEIEKNSLRKLPEQRFEIPAWKAAKVHPDQFIQFEKKSYGLPPEYRGKTVWVRKCDKIIKIFHNYRLIRQFVIPRGHRVYDKNDFPEDKMKMLQEDFPQLLIKKASRICAQAKEYIENILQPHAYLNLRRAQGILKFLENNRFNPYLPQACTRAKNAGIVNPKGLKELLKSESKQNEFNWEVPISESGQAMVRDSKYYTND